MKILKPLLFSCIFLLISSNTQAQFLEKLKQKAAQAIENVVVDKTANKAAEIAGKSMDKIFDIDFKGPQADPSILPEKYVFEWEYTMQMEYKKNTMNMTYYLTPGAKYFGSEPEMEGNAIANSLFMIFDEDLDAMVIFMGTKDTKSGTLLKNPTSKIDDIEDVTNSEDYTYTEIGTKTILGYKCQGFQMENDELKMTMYMAVDSPVSFNQIYGNHMKTTPKGLDPKWLEKADNSIVMEMELVNKKKKKYSATMTCIALKESPKTVVVSDYEFMNLNQEEIQN